MSELSLKNPVGPYFSTQKIWLVFSAALLVPLIPGLMAMGWEGLLLLGTLGASAFLADRLVALSRKKTWKPDAALLFQVLLLLAFLPSGTSFWVTTAGGILLVLFRMILGNPSWIHPVLAVWMILILSFSPASFALTATPQTELSGPAQPLAVLKARLLQPGSPPQGAMEGSGIQRSEPDQKGADWLNNQVFGLFNVNLPGGYLDLLFGRAGGSLGGAAGFFILLSSILLLGLRLISWEVPMMMFLSHSIFIWIFGGTPFQGGLFSGDILFHTLSGSFLLGMFFAATDYSTVPLSREGKLTYGLVAGALVALSRTATFQAEGTVVSLVLMNLLLPVFERRKKTAEI